MSKDTGGPAFARPYSQKGNFSDTGHFAKQDGMTLRDYMAAKALQAMISTAAAPCLIGLEGCESVTAEAAYKMADAMLIARSA